MARGVNKAIIVGNLGADPEVRYTPGGTAVANMRVATTDSWFDKQSGERQERTEWHRVVAFARTAEVAGEYLRKGSKVYIEGRLQTRKWQGQDGQDRYTTEIVCNDLQMLDSRSSGTAPMDDRPAESQTAASSASAPAAAASGGASEASDMGGESTDGQGGGDDPINPEDDDIPF